MNKNANLKLMIFQHMTHLRYSWVDRRRWRNGNWSILPCSDISHFLMFYPGEICSKELSGYKNSKTFGYCKPWWLQPLQYHNLSGSKNFIIRGDCRKTQSIKDPLHKILITLEKLAEKGPDISRV